VKVAEDPLLDDPALLDGLTALLEAAEPAAWLTTV
jgi:hypothetical protein